MKIENSLGWDNCRSELKRQIQKLPYSSSNSLMLKNIDDMVDQLSRLEVEARRTKVRYYADRQLSKVNESIKTLDELIILGILFN